MLEVPIWKRISYNLIQMNFSHSEMNESTYKGKNPLSKLENSLLGKQDHRKSKKKHGWSNSFVTVKCKLHTLSVTVKTTCTFFYYFCNILLTLQYWLWHIKACIMNHKYTYPKVLDETKINTTGPWWPWNCSPESHCSYATFFFLQLKLTMI